MSSAPAAGRPRPAAWQQRAVVAADIACCAIALCFAIGLIDAHRELAALVCAPLVLVVGKLLGLYRSEDLRLARSTLDEAPLLMRVAGLSALAIAIVEPVLTRATLSGFEIAGLWAALSLALAAARLLARTATRRFAPVERCLLIGDHGQADLIRDRLESSGIRAQVIASVPLTGADLDGLAAADGAGGSFRELVRELEADRIIVALGSKDGDHAGDLLRLAKAVGVRVSVLPGAFDLVAGATVQLDDVGGLTLLGVRRFGLSSSSRVLKRGFDLAAASIGMLIASPVLLAIAVAIRLDSRGPVFFRQVRVGRDGRHFRIFKFRSMVADAEARQEELRARSEAGDGLFKLSDDPRVTRVGRFLRRSSLDELPQIINVLRGEMSLVGPRPLVVDEDAGILGLDRSRLSMPPGMTGPWQVLAVRVPRREMIAIDYRYADSWSLWLDLKIILRTALHVLRRRNL